MRSASRMRRRRRWQVANGRLWAAGGPTALKSHNTLQKALTRHQSPFTAFLLHRWQVACEGTDEMNLCRVHVIVA